MSEFRLPAKSVRKERIILTLLCSSSLIPMWVIPGPHALVAGIFAVGIALAIGNWAISHCAHKIVIRLTTEGISGTDRNGKTVDLRWDEPVSLIKGSGAAMIKYAALFAPSRQVSLEIPLAIINDAEFIAAVQKLAPAKYPLKESEQKSSKPILEVLPRTVMSVYALSLVVRTSRLVWIALGALSLAALLSLAKRPPNFDLGLFIYQHDLHILGIAIFALTLPLQMLAKYFYGEALWKKYESTFTLRGVNLPPGKEFYSCMTAPNTSLLRKLSGLLLAALYPIVFTGLGALLGFFLWQWLVTGLELVALSKASH